MTPSQLERRWRRLVFERDHARNLAAWHRSDLERRAQSMKAIELTWSLIDLNEHRRRMDWAQLERGVALRIAREATRSTGLT